MTDDIIVARITYVYQDRQPNLLFSTSVSLGMVGNCPYPSRCVSIFPIETLKHYLNDVTGMYVYTVYVCMYACDKCLCAVSLVEWVHSSDGSCIQGSL